MNKYTIYLKSGAHFPVTSDREVHDDFLAFLFPGRKGGSIATMEASIDASEIAAVVKWNDPAPARVGERLMLVDKKGEAWFQRGEMFSIRACGDTAVRFPRDHVEDYYGPVTEYLIRPVDNTDQTD